MLMVFGIQELELKAEVNPQESSRSRRRRRPVRRSGGHDSALAGMPDGRAGPAQCRDSAQAGHNGRMTPTR